MGYIKDVRRIYRLLRTAKGRYDVARAFVAKVQRQLRLAITIAVIFALVVLAGLIYIAVRVS